MTDHTPSHPPETHVRKVVGIVVIVLALGWAATNRDDQSTPVVTRSTTSVSPPAERSGNTTATTPADACAALGEHVRAAATTATVDDAVEAIVALERVLDEMRADATAAPPDVRAVSEQIVELYAFLPEPGRRVIDAAAASGDEEVIALADEAVRLTHRMMLHPWGLVDMGQLDGACPGLLDELTTGSAGPTEDLTVRLRAIAERLDELGVGDVVADYLDPGLLDLTNRDMTAALSGLQDEYEDCLVDTDALTPGDNDGCDALHEACDQRDLLACNDLYWSSVVGSEYETFGATCGGRTEFGRAGFGGFCEELE